MQLQQTTMDPQTQAAWDAWVTSHIKKHIDESESVLLEAVRKAFGMAGQRVKKSIAEETAKPIEQIDQLRKR